jgi:hypothetical protein
MLIAVDKGLLHSFKGRTMDSIGDEGISIV